MDNKSIITFLTVAEEGSFRKAAQQLGYTQAGISYIIKAMEEEMGLVLFHRNKNGVKLSPEGISLYPHIRQLQIDNLRLSEMIRDLKNVEYGNLKIQVFDSVSIHWLPGILSEFKKDYPNISVEIITEEDSVKAEEMVSTGEVDCGFFLTGVSSNLDVFELLEENMLAIVSPDHELAGSDRFPVSKLGDYPFISMKYDHNTGINEIFRNNNAVPDTAYLMDNDYAAMAMVSRGHGYCIFPELLLQDVPYTICCLEFDVPQKRVIRIGTRSMVTASQACRKFIEYSIRWVSENTRKNF